MSEFLQSVKYRLYHDINFHDKSSDQQLVEDVSVQYILSVVNVKYTLNLRQVTYNSGSDEQQIKEVSGC